MRLDKWLWHARFFKTRTVATKSCLAGAIRVNGLRSETAHQPIAVGDVLTFARGNHVFIVRVSRLSERRGPATEAQSLYEMLGEP